MSATVQGWSEFAAGDRAIHQALIDWKLSPVQECRLGWYEGREVGRYCQCRYSAERHSDPPRLRIDC